MDSALAGLRPAPAQDWFLARRSISVYSLDLGTKQLRKVLDDESIRAICILSDLKSLAYIKASPGEDGKRLYRPALAGLDGPPGVLTVLDIDSSNVILDCSRCWYDPLNSVFFIKTGVFNPDYRVRWSFKEMLIQQN